MPELASKSEVTTPRSSTTPKSSSTPQQKTSTESNENADDTPSQKKKGNSNYWQYKNREGPKNLGSKEIPEVNVYDLTSLSQWKMITCLFVTRIAVISV